MIEVIIAIILGVVIISPTLFATYLLTHWHTQTILKDKQGFWEDFVDIIERIRQWSCETTG